MFLHSPPLLQPNYIVQLVVLSCIKVKISIIYTLCVVHLSFDIENDQYLHSIFLAFCMLYHAILIITSSSHMYMDHGLCATTTIRGRNSNLIHGKGNNRVCPWSIFLHVWITYHLRTTKLCLD